MVDANHLLPLLVKQFHMEAMTRMHTRSLVTKGREAVIHRLLPGHFIFVNRAFESHHASD